MKENGTKADDSSNARVEQGLTVELCYIHEKTVVRYKSTRFGELC